MSRPSVAEARLRAEQPPFYNWWGNRLEHKWTREELHEAVKAMEQLKASPAWAVLTRLAKEQDDKIVLDLIDQNQSHLEYEGNSNRVKGLRMALAIPEVVLHAGKVVTARIEAKQHGDR